MHMATTHTLRELVVLLVVITLTPKVGMPLVSLVRLEVLLTQRETVPLVRHILLTQRDTQQRQLLQAIRQAKTSPIVLKQITNLMLVSTSLVDTMFKQLVQELQVMVQQMVLALMQKFLIGMVT